MARAMALHNRITGARSSQRRADYVIATLLVEFAEGRLYRQLGYASVINYADVALGLSPRVTRDWLALGRAIVDLPVLSAALQAGVIDWTKARELVRVATPETEQAWVERAQNVSCRAIESEVAHALVGELPPAGPPHPERRPARGRVVFEMEAADAEVLRTALSVLRAQSALNPAELSDGALLAAMARNALVSAERDGSEFVPTGERYRVVIEHCPSCRHNVAPTAEVSDTIAAEACCDAEIVEMRPGPKKGHATRAVPDSTRRKVFHRARWACQVPECRNRLWLDIHHLQPWGKGGRHEDHNLVAICCAHHRAVHDGHLAVERGTTGVIEVRHRDGRVVVGREGDFPTWGTSGSGN